MRMLNARESRAGRSEVESVSMLCSNECEALSSWLGSDKLRNGIARQWYSYIIHQVENSCDDWSDAPNSGTS